MKYRIMYAHSVIGTSILEASDPTMGMAFGAFLPTPDYERVRHVFDLFTEANERRSDAERKELRMQYSRARDALDLRLETEDSRKIPTGWIHISEVEPGQYDVEVQIPDPTFFLSQA